MNKDDKSRLDRLEGKIDDIRDNHIVHIYKHLGNLSGKMTVLIPLIIAILMLLGGLYALLIREIG